MTTYPSLTRRSVLGLAAGGLALAAGCSSGQTAPGTVASSGAAAAPAPQGPLDVALWGDVKRADLYQKALDLFVSKNPSITANKLQYADLTPYLEKLATAAAAKDLPDVFFMRDTHIGRYGKSKAALDLRPWIDKGVIDVSDIGKAAVADGTVAGGVYALPTHYVGQAILWDEAKMTAAGIDLNSVTTWDQLADAAKALTKGNGQFGMTDPTVGSTPRHMEAWIRQAGEEMFTPDGDIGFKAATLEAWYAYWDKLRKAGVIPSASQQVEADGGGWPTHLLVTGKAAIAAASTNHLTLAQALTKAKIVMGSVPANKGGTDDWWFFPPILISAAANTPAPEASAKLISFLINDVDAGKITKVSQGAPSAAKVRDAIAGDLDAAAKTFVDQISREQKMPRRPFPVRPEGSEAVNSSITFHSQEIAFGKLSISDGVAKLIADCKQKLGK